MIMIRYLFSKKDVCLLCVLFLFLTGCVEKDSEGGETYINLQSDVVLFESKGGSIELSFKASGSWTAVPYHTSGNWCTIDNTGGGKGNAILVISASENESFDERNTAIKITCNDISKKITVTQKQKNAILLSSNKIEIDQDGGDKQITVNYNVPYDCVVESGSDWITIVESTNTKGMDTCDFSLKIAPNPQFEQRHGIVIVRSETLSERIDVYQTGSVPRMVLSENEHIAKSSGDTVKVEVSSNCDYSCRLPDMDWIYETESGLQSAFTHYFAVMPNNTDQARTATVIFTNLYNGSKEELKITQLPKNSITTARSEYNLSSSKKEILLRINSNVDFKTDVPVDWIHVSQKETSEPLRFYDIAMVVDENKTSSLREAYVTFYTVELIQRVIVRQDGRSDYIKAVVSHSSSEITASVSGSKIYGNVDWGDGNRNDLIQSNIHFYEDTIDRKATFDCWGAGSFRLSSLTNITCVEIYVNGDDIVDAESFVVEQKEWD